MPTNLEEVIEVCRYMCRDCGADCTFSGRSMKIDKTIQHTSLVCLAFSFFYVTCFNFIMIIPVLPLYKARAYVTNHVAYITAECVVSQDAINSEHCLSSP
jgi:hypothetical protein